MESDRCTDFDPAWLRGKWTCKPIYVTLTHDEQGKEKERLVDSDVKDGKKLQAFIKA